MTRKALQVRKTLYKKMLMSGEIVKVAKKEAFWLHYMKITGKKNIYE